MAVYDTTDVIDSSIFLKAKLDTNMVGTNYYIENLQNKRNQDWNYRYNVVNIEEELNKQTSYTKEVPCYTPIDCVIRHVKPEYGDVFGDDWADISFRDLKHPNGVGYRYRFSWDFPDMSPLSEEEKKDQTSIWIGVNKTSVNPGNSCVIRRCNSYLTFLGSPTRSNDYVEEVHMEPCALDNEMKYMQVYYNLTIPVPQAEWYATMQLNYFTNNIKINDRFLFGVIDTENRENNQAYKVKAVVKSQSSRTFTNGSQDELEKTPLVIIALDKDAVSPSDDLVNRIAGSTTVYKTIEKPPTYTYHIDLDEPNEGRILLNQSADYKVSLLYNKQKQSGITFTFTTELRGIVQKNWGNYYVFTQTGPDTFNIKNIKACTRGPLVVNAVCTDPSDPDKAVQEAFEIELGGFY